jgi:hypothetical protein
LKETQKALKWGHIELNSIIYLRSLYHMHWGKLLYFTHLLFRHRHQLSTKRKRTFVMSSNDARGFAVATRIHGLKDPEYSQAGQEQQEAVGRGRSPGDILLPLPQK